MKHCESCGCEISNDARMCKWCAPKNPRKFEHTSKILDILEPLVLEQVGGNDVIAVKPLVRTIMADAPPELCRNRPTISRLTKHILRERGYVVYTGSSKHSVWMCRVGVTV